MTTLAQSIPVVEDVAPSDHAEEKDNGSEDGERKAPVDGQVASTGSIPWRYRVGALAFIIFITSGIEFAESTLGPLKHTLVTEMGVTNAQYGVITTSTNLVNTVLPILGGIGMDYYGAGYAALVASSFGAIGIIITASSANTGHYGLMVGGRVIMGIGSSVIESTQNKLYAHWFTGTNLAFVVAIDIAWRSVVTIVAKATAVPMSRIHGWYGWALWIPAILSVVCVGIVIGYLFYEKSVPLEYRPVRVNHSTETVGWRRWKLALKRVTGLPMFFWIFCGTELFQNSARSVYNISLSDIQRRTRGTSDLAAGYNSSLQNVVTVVVVPLLGWCFDRFGWRMLCVSVGGALYMVVFALIGLTTVHPLGPIILSSFALSFNVIPFLASIPLMINDPTMMGTAYGVWTSFIACNNVILEVAAGAIQDKTPGQSYDRVIYLLLAIKGTQVLLGPIYDYLDGRWMGHTLRKSEKQRIKLREDMAVEGVELPGWKVHRPTTWTVSCQLGAMVVVSWIIFFIYLV